MSPAGGDALQAPECTQTLGHRGAAQPERARHRALCERERGWEKGRGGGSEGVMEGQGQQTKGSESVDGQMGEVVRKKTKTGRIVKRFIVVKKVCKIDK